MRRLAARPGHRRITLVDSDRPGASGQRFPARPAARDREPPRPPGGPRGARRAASGVATRRSETVGRSLLYVAVPGGPGAVRVAADLRQVDDVVRRAQARGGRRRAARAAGGRAPRPHRRPLDRPAAHRDRRRRPCDRRGIPAPVSPLGHSRHRRAGPGAAPDAPAARPIASTSCAASRRRSAALVESMVEGVVAADERGRIVTANPAARRLLGYDPARSAARPAPSCSG